MKQSLKYIGVFLLWNIVVGGFLLFTPPVVALPIALVLSAILLWGYLLRAPRGARPASRWAALRLRPLRGGTLGWTLAAVPVVLVLSWALGDLYTRVVPVPADSLNPFEPILRTADGRLIIAIFAVAIAPVVEEFFFRGLIQSRLESLRGPAGGIALAAALFAVVHLLPWVFPLHFFLGVAFGFAVWAARSIWTGVILHAANNAAAMLGLAFGGAEPPPTGTLWEVGLTGDLWFSLVALGLGVIAATHVGANLYAAGRGSGSRAG